MILITSVTDVFETLGRDPAELIGVPETDFVDFKRTAYRLKSEKERFELAKDVSAMANTEEAGVIVLGIGTQRASSLQQDVAVSVRPVVSGLVDVQQVQQIIWEWVYPRLDVRIRSHRVKKRAGALWTILVDRQRERDLPFIVAKEFIGRRGAARNLFGAYKRHSSHNAPYAPAVVHSWLRRGWGTAATKGPAMVDEGLARKEGESLAERILREDVSTIGMEEGGAYYYLQVMPGPGGAVENFYRGARGSLYETMKRIPAIRRLGFGLAEGEPAQTQWDGLRVVEPGVSSISVSRKAGITTAVLSERTLTWASERFAPKGQVYVNPLALVEFTLEFWRFYFGEIARRVEGTTGGLWRAGMEGVREPVPMLLPEEPLSQRVFLQASEGKDFQLPWSATEEADPDRLAFGVLTEVYAQFGLGEGAIPYAEGKRVSEDAIREV